MVKEVKEPSKKLKAKLNTKAKPKVDVPIPTDNDTLVNIPASKIKSIFQAVVVFGLHLLLAFPLASLILDDELSYFLEDGNIGLFIIAQIIVFLPLVSFFFLIYVAKKKSMNTAWKLFTIAEIPIFLTSILLLALESAQIPLYISLLLEIIAVGGLIFDTFSKHEVSPKEKKILQGITVIASGLATYVFFIWILFIFYMGEIIWEGFGYIFEYFYWDEFLLFLLAMFLLLSPVRALIFYGKWMLQNISEYKELIKIPALKGKSLEKYSINSIFLFSSLIIVYLLLILSNPTTYKFGNSQYLLRTRNDFVEVYSESNLEEKLASEYAYSDQYLPALECREIKNHSSIEEKENDVSCDILDSISSFVLTPYMVVGGDLMNEHSPSEFIVKLYETDYKKQFDYDKYNSLADDHYSYRTSVFRLPNINEEQDVFLYSLDDQITVDVSEGTAQHLITMYLTTTERRQQEAIFLLSLPSNAVITDLNLGKNLELPKLVAPRGAADQVYEASVRRSTDPAVVSKVGNGLYRVKVFPVFSNAYSDESLMQKIQITYVVPTSNEIFFPQITSENNLEINWKSDIQGRIDIINTSEYKEGDIFDEGLEFTWNTGVKRDSNSITLDISEEISPYCVSNQGSGFADSAIVLFDTSYSAHDQWKTYRELADDIGSMYNEIEYYTYASEVHPWGTKSGFIFYGDNVPGVLESFLQTKYDIDNKDVYVVTDGNSYSRPLEEWDKLDSFYGYNNVKGKYFILFTEEPKVVSDELGQVVSMTGGYIGTFSMLQRYIDYNYYCSKSTVLGDNSTINSAVEADFNLRNVSDKKSYLEIGRMMWKDANNYSYVDSMNSFIALENDTQYRQLIEASMTDSAFDFDGDLAVQNTTIIMPAPEPKGLFVYFQLIAIIAIGLNLRKSKRYEEG